MLAGSSIPLPSCPICGAELVYLNHEHDRSDLSTREVMHRKVRARFACEATFLADLPDLVRMIDGSWGDGPLVPRCWKPHKPCSNFAQIMVDQVNAKKEL